MSDYPGKTDRLSFDSSLVLKAAYIRATHETRPIAPIFIGVDLAVEKDIGVFCMKKTNGQIMICDVATVDVNNCTEGTA